MTRRQSSASSAPLALPARSIARAAVRWRWFTLAVGLLTLIPLSLAGSHLTMNRSLLSMFSASDPALQDYQSLQSTFGGNLVVMVVVDDPAWKTSDGLARNRKWTEQAEAISGVRGVLSVAKLAGAFTFLRPGLGLNLLGGPVDPDSVPLFDASDAIARDFLALFAGYTHAPTGNAVAIVAMLDPAKTTEAVAGLKQFATTIAPEFRPAVVGEPVLLEDAFEMIEKDGRRLALGTIVLLSLVIVLTLRDLRVVALSMLAIGWSVMATRAAMAGLAIELSLVSTILTAVVTVVVVASVMHLGVRRRTQTLLATIAMLASPIAWTCLTDAAGFASLSVSSVVPVRQFGGMIALASVAVLVSLALFAPAILSPRRGLAEGTLDVDLVNRSATLAKITWLHRSSRRIATVSIQLRWPLVIAAVATTAIATWQVTRLSTKASFLDNFESGSDIVLAYDRVESELGGAGVWDVVVPVGERLSADELASVRELENQLRAIEVVDPSTGETAGLTKVLSLADADAIAARSLMLSLAPPDVRLVGMRRALPTFADALLTFPGSNDESQNGSPRAMRIMLRSRESLGASGKRALIAQVRATVSSWQESSPRPQGRRVLVTGYMVLMSQLVDSLLRDQWTALATALASVGGLLWIATRRWLVTAAALLVNTLPIMVVLAIIGWVGGELDMGSAMIGAVSIGLSIDGSIHYLAGVARRRRRGDGISESAIAAAADLGTPMLLATIALVIGFGVLVTSPFVPTATFGKLVAATLATSAVTNLTLLPALVVLVNPTVENLESAPEDFQ